jgi:hypothetical protein
MKNRITKQVKKELKNILDEYGYWSEETRIYLDQFEYFTRNKLHGIAQVYDKYRYGL